jgi:Phospholipid methyltransferase
MLLAIVLFIPWVYLQYSLHTYFGMDRAMGLDHFDPSYRHRPFVREGIFRYTDNAIYTFGFLLFWILGLVFLSQAALLAALFNHLYIWVHYYCTELPDISAIYGKKGKEVVGHAAPSAP